MEEIVVVVMLMTLWHFIECCGIWEFVHSILVRC